MPPSPTLTFDSPFRELRLKRQTRRYPIVSLVVKSPVSSLPVRRSFRAKVDAPFALRNMESAAITTKEFKALNSGERARPRVLWSAPPPNTLQPSGPQQEV